MSDAGTVRSTTTRGEPADDADGLTVGRTARLVGVSVRTLHHWDEIGLVRPSTRSWAGYRLYDTDDVARIHQVLVYRETGMSLAEIARVLDSPDVDPRAHLARQRELLTDCIAHLTRMVRAVDTMMEETMNETGLTAARRASIFGTDWGEQWREEAEERWGGTDEWAQSEARKAAMTQEDWARVAQESLQLITALVDAKREGVKPGSRRANELAEQHRASIDQWFDTTHSKQVLIARGYVADPRFTEFYDGHEAGLTAWLKEVIDANAAAHGVDPANACWE